MPLFEYKCKQCGKVQEHLVRVDNEIPVCSCGSNELTKLLSTFAVSMGSEASSPPCATGNCGIPQSQCPSGICGLS